MNGCRSGGVRSQPPSRTTESRCVGVCVCACGCVWMQEIMGAGGGVGRASDQVLIERVSRGGKRVQGSAVAFLYERTSGGRTLGPVLSFKEDDRQPAEREGKGTVGAD